MSNTTSTAHFAPAQAVLRFWLQDAMELGWPSQSPTSLWFGGGQALDSEIEREFGGLVREALAGGLSGWEATPPDRLALIIVLDQFTRNLFRGQAQAFAGDARAQRLVLDALALGWDQQLPLAGRVFLGMPLMHAETPTLQDLSVAHFEVLVTAAPPALTLALSGHLEFAQKHREIIARFGRFPHRNKSLGRSNTPDEDTFLQTGPRFGQ